MMIENTENSLNDSAAATPVIRQRRPFSIVWIIPLVAMITGGWLVYKAVTEKGPVITVIFNSANGLEAGKTKVKFRNVDVGVVESIGIGEDLAHVAAKIQMNKGSDPYLTENTKFWVVRARITASEVTGLGTLLGGAYIGIEPSEEGTLAKSFVGLEKEPIITSEMRGRQFTLSAHRLGSLNPGSPIYFRQIKVGKVVDYQLDTDGNEIGFTIFIDSPYDQFVRSNTRFWISSGLDLQLTANGLQVDTESIVSLMIGGIAFSTFNEEPSPKVETDAHFTLFNSRTEAQNAQYLSKNEYYTEFSDSIRGLSVGAPVEFRGFQVGSVTDIQLKSDFTNLIFSTMVRISIEHNRITIPEEGLSEDLNERLDHFVKGGLRAQLKTGNLLTGQLFVNLEYFVDVQETKTSQYEGLPVVPSIPTSSQELMSDAAGFMKKLNNLPLEDIAAELKKTMIGIDKLANNPDIHEAFSSLNHIIKQLDTTIEMINSGTIPQVNSTLTEVETLVKEMDNWVSADSPLYDDLRTSFKALSEAARAISDLADMLARHPEALIQGKNSEGQL